MPPRIAFVTTCRGRLQHLRFTLPQNLIDNSNYPNCIFVVLGYGDAELHDYMAGDPHGAAGSGRLAYYDFPGIDTFHMAHAKNMAHRCGMLEGADILVNLDADNLTTPGFAQYIAGQFKHSNRMFMWSRMIKGQFRRGISGRIVVTPNALLLTGGYDQKYNNWGPDDKDFNIRLQRLGYTPIEIDAQYLDAVSHNDKMRFREYPNAKQNYYVDMRVEDCTGAIANYGKFGCGTVYRNFSSDPIVLDPLPTRVFGIGMHKTATTSLHMALTQLGFDSGHWKSAHWAKAIWQQMNNTGKSPALERNYSLCDLPIPLLYRKLDKAYPGSKFILTWLDEDVWLRSAELHWDAKSNPMRSNWDNDPFTHRIHEVLYGQREFNRDIFLARYRHHNRDVVDYFKDRPGDLLVMNMSACAGWKELCGFLGKPIPDTPYPHGNRDAAARYWDSRHNLHAGDL